MIIGIDNGLSGGIVVLSRLKCAAPVAMLAMPCKTVTGGREVDVIRLTHWLRDLDWSREEPPVVFLEECPKHSRDKIAMRSMAFTAGLIAGAVMARLPQWRLVRVRSGNSGDSWQRAMLGKVPKGKTKEYALAAALGIWPEEKWLATARSSVPHDGLIDAALIAEFGRRKGGQG